MGIDKILIDTNAHQSLLIPVQFILCGCMWGKKIRPTQVHSFTTQLFYYLEAQRMSA